LKTELIILFSLLSFFTGITAGILISLIYYPKWEINKLIRQQRKEGYSFGEWNHFKNLADHNIRVVVKPNCETLYSISFIRRKDGPYILNMPRFDSYFSFAFLNRNTDIQGYITNRDAAGNKGNKFLISYIEQEISDINLPGIKLNSRVSWIIGRFEIKSPGEIQEVNRIQDEICLIKLKDYLNDSRKKD
jgi:hypothetical protein